MAANAADYYSKFPRLSHSEIKSAEEHYNQVAVGGRIHDKQVVELFKDLGTEITIEQAKKNIEQFDIDGDGTLDFFEFLEIFNQEKEGKTSAFTETLKKHAQLIKLKGKGGAERSYAQEEVSGYVNHLNACLADDEDLKGIIPIDPDSDEFFKKLQDGLLLCKMVNLAQADTIDERTITKGKKLNVYSAAGNIDLALNSAKSIGISTLNIGNTDIRDGTIHLVLGLTWQIVRMSLLKTVNLTNHPELFRLLKPGEQISDLLKLTPEQILIRWMNYHLEHAKSKRVATNFTSDLSDSEILTIVLNQVAPEACAMRPMSESDPMKRAELMLQEADKINCRKFVGPKEIVKGNQRLNLAFVATIFNTRPGLEELTEKELAGLNEALFAAGGTRIERQYCLWMNSCGVEPFVVDLYDGISDGLVLLQMFDKIEPGCVDWSKVAKTKLNKFKAVSNCDQVIEIGKKLGLSLVGISGTDINTGNKKLVMALLWQMMRYDYLKTFKKLGGGARIKDEQIVKWANETTKGVTHIDSFKDQAIRNSRPILALIDILKPDTVDWTIFEDSEDEEKLARNAKYVLSMIRKFGGTVYALPDDILEVNPQMVMTVYASLMAMQN
jgi:plastin-1